MLGCLCGKTGTIMYYLHCNYYKAHDLVGGALLSGVPVWGAVESQVSKNARAGPRRAPSNGDERLCPGFVSISPFAARTRRRAVVITCSLGYNGHSFSVAAVV